MKFWKSAIIITLAAVGLVMAAGLAAAEEKPLIIAFRGDAATLDPHGRSETTTIAIQAHFYERLVQLDPALKIKPDLAESWSVIDPLTWEFKLKKGVKFHNGEPFNAEAAKYSIIRAKTWDKSQWKGVVPNYKEIQVIDDYTLRIVTREPEPEAALMLTDIFMVPPKYFSETPEAELAVKPVGTGPYTFVEWVKGDHCTMAANPDWNKGQVDFKKVVIRPIPEDATRVAALVSGEIDVCWGVSIPDIPRIEKNKNTYVDRAPSVRVIYLMFDVHSDKGGKAPQAQPGIPAGQPNPFKNLKVRQAIAHAINVEELIQYVMEGSAYPATQMVSAYSPGYNPDIKQAKFDPALAKKLLKEAGFEKGFTANFDCPNDRYINDQMMTEAIAQQLKKNLGLNLKVVAQPKAVFFPKMNRHESPMFLAGWGLISWAGTMNNFYYRKGKGFGRNNRGRLSDPELEKRIAAANAEMDPKKRLKMRQAVMAEAIATRFAIPLYHQENVNGYSNRVIGKARVNEYIHAWEIKKAK